MKRPSPLQRQLLRLAISRPDPIKGRRGEKVDITFADALAYVGGLTPTDRWSSLGNRFDHQALGVDRCNRVSASISRSLRRLVARGFLVRAWATEECACSGWSITEAGRAELARFDAENGAPKRCAPVNRSRGPKAGRERLTEAQIAHPLTDTGKRP